MGANSALDPPLARALRSFSLDVGPGQVVRPVYRPIWAAICKRSCQKEKRVARRVSSKLGATHQIAKRTSTLVRLAELDTLQVELPIGPAKKNVPCF